MTVVFVSDQLPPAVDGVGDYTYFLGIEFAKAGHRVHVVCSVLKEIETEVSTMFKVHPVVEKWNKFGIAKAIQTIQGLQSDWVLLQYVPYSFSDSGMPWEMRTLAKQLRQLGIPLCTTFHEVCIRLKFNNLKLLYRGIAQRLIARSIAKNSIKNITSIDFYAHYLKQWTHHVIQIQIGSNIPAISVSEKALHQLRSTITPNGEFLIATFGKRDHLALLVLFQQLIAIYPNCKLMICGKTPKIHIPDDLLPFLYITGYLDREGVYQHLKCSDLFMQFSMGEGGVCNKSGSLAAAFTAGLPILGNKGDMTNQTLIIEDVVIFADKNGAENAVILKNLIEDPTKRHWHAQRTIEYHEKYLAWEAIYLQYKSWLEQK